MIVISRKRGTDVSRPMNRRVFLSTISVALADSLPGQQAARYNDNPFALGVASGDPLRAIGPNLR
jgi:phosphodiesterase/alkaline phosphatase D-like protein